MSSQQSPSATQQVEQKVEQAAEQAQQQADHLAGMAKQQVSSQAESRKNQAANELSAVADAVRQAGQQLRQQQHQTVAHYADMAAQRVDQVSQSLQQQDVSQLVSEAERFVRKRPGLFVGSAFALGLVGARFLKSSSTSQGRGAGSQPDMEPSYRYQSPAYSAGAPPRGSVSDPAYPTPSATTYAPDTPGREG